MFVCVYMCLCVFVCYMCVCLYLYVCVYVCTDRLRLIREKGHWKHPGFTSVEEEDGDDDMARRDPIVLGLGLALIISIATLIVGSVRCGVSNMTFD